MKVVYRLPQFLVIVVIGWIAYSIYPYVKLANTTDFFEMVKYENEIKVPVETLLGLDSYLVLMMIGLFFAIVLAVLRRGLLDVNFGVAALIAILFFLQAYLGAKILYGLEQVLSDMSWSSFDLKGHSLYGTVLMTFIFIPVLAKILKKETKAMFDYVAPLWLTLLIFVRIGCFVIGCCGADKCWIGEVQLILPVQLFEVVCSLIIFQIIFAIESKSSNWCNRYIRTGDSFYITIGLYGICEFCMGFARTTDVVVLGVTYGQIYSIICILIAISYIDNKRKGVNSDI